MNAAPFGGSMALTPDPPYVALSVPIGISAIQWFDDESDLPLVYSFAYAPNPAPGTAVATSLGREGISPVGAWEAPIVGNWTLVLTVKDTFGASAVRAPRPPLSPPCHCPTWEEVPQSLSDPLPNLGKRSLSHLVSHCPTWEEVPQSLSEPLPNLGRGPSVTM
jgi:hypothetical protein